MDAEQLKLPHQKAPSISAYFGGRAYAFADFTYLPTRCKFVALMPQWDFLDFLARHAARPHLAQLAQLTIADIGADQLE